MRRLALMLLILCFTREATAGTNDRIRRSSRGTTSTADGGSRSSNDGGDIAGFCNCLLACLDLADTCAWCSVHSQPQTVIVVDRPPAQGPYYVPPAGPAPPLHAMVTAGIARAALHPVWTPRLQAYVDLPMNSWTAFRLGGEFESFTEWLPAASNESSTKGEWDSLPLGTLRGGYVLRFESFELGLVAGLRLLDVSPRGATRSDLEPGIDLGAQVLLDRESWFFEAGVVGIAFQGLAAWEPWVRAGVGAGPWRFALGIRHLQFFDNAFDPLQYSGPELSIGLRL